jgi:hypothetical protein
MSPFPYGATIQGVTGLRSLVSAVANRRSPCATTPRCPCRNPRYEPRLLRRPPLQYCVQLTGVTRHVFGE